MSEKKALALEHLSKIAARSKAEAEALVTAAEAKIPTKLGDLTNDQNFQTKTQVDEAIAAKLSSAYRAGGTLATPDTSKLVAANEGLVYNISTKFSTDAEHFVEGLNKSYPAGTNVVVVKHESEEKYLFDVLAGFVDLSGYAEKVSEPTDGNLVSMDASGGLSNSGKKPSDFVAAETGKRLMTTEEGEKLAGIQAGATKVEVPETPDGSINVNDQKKQVYTLPSTVLQESDFASDEEVEEILDEVYGTDE